MSKQIAVRLTNELVEFVDTLVNSGEATSRAAVVTRALIREQRRVSAIRDAAILATKTTKDDFDNLAAYAANQVINLD